MSSTPARLSASFCLLCYFPILPSMSKRDNHLKLFANGEKVVLVVKVVSIDGILCQTWPNISDSLIKEFFPS